VLIIPSDGTNQTQIKNTYFTTSESLAPIGAISTPFCATRKGKNTTCGNNIYVLCSNFLVATNFGKQWNQSSKRIRDYKDEINSMEQLELECPNGRRQTLELHRKETNFGLASYKNQNSQHIRSLEVQWPAHCPKKKSIFTPFDGLTSACMNTKRRDETIIPLGAMPSEAMAAGPKCRNQPTCESGAGPVKMVRSEYK
jgi:hypothetical protein